MCFCRLPEHSVLSRPAGDIQTHPDRQFPGQTWAKKDVASFATDQSLLFSVVDLFVPTASINQDDVPELYFPALRPKKCKGCVQGYTPARAPAKPVLPLHDA